MFRFIDKLEQAILNSFDFLSPYREAKKMREHSEGRQLSSRFAIHASICAFAMLIMVCGIGAFLILKLFSLTSLDIALGVIFSIISFLLLAHTLENWFLQLSLNKSNWTWVSLGFVIFCILASIGILVGFSFI